jgi:hypothetical protein
MAKLRQALRTDDEGRLRPVYDDQGHPVMIPADPMAEIQRENAEAAALSRAQLGLDTTPPPRPLPAGVILTGPLQQHLKQLTAWPPGPSLCRLVLTACPLEHLPDLRERISPNDAYQLDGVPVVVLGECRVVSKERKGQMYDGYEAQEYYAIERALVLTRQLRDQQIETEHAKAGPGRRHHDLAAEVAAIKERVKV